MEEKKEGNAYCYNCEILMSYDEQSKKFVFNCHCYDGIPRKRILLYCNCCGKFTSRQGVSKNSKCMRCAVIQQHKTMKENDPAGYAKRQSNASQKAIQSMKENHIGIFSEEGRAKIEQTKQENEFYEKLHKANEKWRQENPDKVKELAAKAAIKGAEIRKETFTEKDWLEWIQRSCNNEESNKKKNVSKSLNSGLKFCEKCQKETFHLNGMCMKCYPSSGTGRSITKEFASMMYKNGVGSKEWKEFNIETDQCNENCENFYSCLYKSIRKKNNWFWCKEMISSFSFKPNFIIRNGVEFTLNHSTGQYEEKDSFFKKFYDKMNQNLKELNNELYQKFFDLGFKFYPVIKSGEESWNKSQTDKMLRGDNIGWMIYIKLFHGIPFIIGKTGTSLVHSSMIDFDFLVYNENDETDPAYEGQGRKFIKEFFPNEKYFDFDKILIKPVESEDEALQIEHELAIKYQLFES